jgi:hypothetical protein
LDRCSVRNDKLGTAELSQRMQTARLSTSHCDG